MNQLYLDLCKVKALLVAGWGQGSGRDETHLCPLDAVWNCIDSPRRSKVISALYCELARTTGRNKLISAWNDDPARTKAEVIDLVQRAANRAGGETIGMPPEVFHDINEAMEEILEGGGESRTGESTETNRSMDETQYGLPSYKGRGTTF